jgi:hypothetical protein
MKAEDIESKQPLADTLPARRVLVIEDTPSFAENALALENCDVTIALSMKMAALYLKRKEFDLVLSDLNFPTRAGGKPRRQDLAIAVHCLWNNLPVAIVTRGDHHGTPHHQGGYPGEHYLFIHTFTPDDLVHCLSEHGFVNRYNQLHNIQTAKFNILSPGHGVYLTMDDCTMRKAELHDQPAKDTAVWKRALDLLDSSILSRQAKNRTFEQSGKEGKRVFVRQAGKYIGIPNARQKAQQAAVMR